jgi:stage II sporulation protein P
MTITKRIKLVVPLILIFLLAASPAAAFDLEKFFDMTSESELREGYFTMVDRDGNTIMRTVRIIHVGDEYIAADNRVYRVVRVEDNKAEARYLRTLSYDAVQAPQNPLTGVVAWFQSAHNRFMSMIQPVQQQGKKTIGIYHSHGAEAYVPSDGAESVDEGGGILQVGASFAAALEKRGVNVIKSDETHVPHDAGAYQRSRRTAEEMAKDNPDAIFDVHRDAVPPEDYVAEVEGQDRVQVQLVVGRQNQNAGSNREFAEGLKAKADEVYPNLVKGIFMARGNYNQDMSPRSMLLEVGTHENTREEAEESIALFAEVVDMYLYASPEGQQFLSPGLGDDASRSALRSALWIILFAAIGVGGYLVISAGGFEQAKEKIKQFTKSEFTNFLGGAQKDEEQQGQDQGPHQQESHEHDEGGNDPHN